MQERSDVPYGHALFQCSRLLESCGNEIKQIAGTFALKRLEIAGKSAKISKILIQSKFKTSNKRPDWLEIATRCDFEYFDEIATRCDFE